MKRRILQKRQENSLGQLPTLAATTEKAPVDTPMQHSIPECLTQWTGNLLYWVANMGAQFYAETVAPFGLLPSHVAVLQVLHGEGAMRQARLTDRTRIDKATMVGLLNELEKQELIERCSAPNDKRAFDVYLTDKGNERVQQIEKVSEAAESQFYGVLSVEEQQNLRALLLRVATQNSHTMPR